MTAPGGAPPVVFGLAGLDRLVAALIADGYRVIGPTVRDNAIVLDELDSADQLPAGWGVDTGPGYYRLRRREDAAVFAHSAGPGVMEAVPAPAAPAAVVGRPRMVRSARRHPRRLATRSSGCGAATWPPSGSSARCSAAGRIAMARSRRTRQGLFIIAVNCTEPGGVCFCASMGTGPAPGLATISRSPSGSMTPGTGSWPSRQPGGRAHPGRVPHRDAIRRRVGVGAGRGERRCRADGPRDAAGDFPR